MTRPTTLQRGAYLVRFIAEIFAHPLNRGHFWGTAWRYLRWHAGSRLLGQPVVYPFVNKLRLIIATRMWGATGVVYCGLEEFGDMAFCAHLLRAQDVFLDVGANYGTYSILASGVGGARTFAFEPNPVTQNGLNENLRLNKLENLVTVICAAVGDKEGEVLITDGMRAGDHIVTEEVVSEPVLRVPMTTLDRAVASEKPTLIKIDVEGYEAYVIAGAKQVLAQSSLLGVIVEDLGLRSRFADTSNVHQILLDHGFASYSYTPETRSLHDLGGQPNRNARNTLYLRNLPEIQKRIEAAPPMHVLGRNL